MRTFVVDTNVPRAANGEAVASTGCVLACISALRDVKASCITLDESYLILQEYRSGLDEHGQGPGDAFLRWVLRAWKTKHCEQVPITQHPDRGFVEFPDDADLTDFDPGDRKFVATARASPHSPDILNAVDTDWWPVRKCLAKHGVTVQFVCRAQMPANE